MAGFDDKENAPARGKGKQRRSREGGSARRLSISGPHDYLKVIAKRFLRKRGIARGRVIARSPVRFDCSPFEFSSRYDYCSEGSLLSGMHEHSFEIMKP